ncbi:MAG: hypothetical protein Q9227_001097 [Pyrenula ochraceoflavens]
MTTGSSDEYIKKLIPIIAYGFSTSSITRRAIVETDAHLPNPTSLSSITLERLEEHFAPSCYGLTRDGAIIAESGNWAAAALWEPSGFVYKNPPLNPDGSRAGPTGRTVNEFWDEADRLQRENLGNEAVEKGRCWHLSRLARAKGREEKGVVSAVIKPFLEKAQEEGLPVWLNATAPNARDMYLHFGFVVVETIRTGAGRLNREGEDEEGGEGFLIWAMSPSTTSLTQLPAELLSTILDLLRHKSGAPTPTLLVVSRVCRKLRALALELIFRKVVVDIEGHKSVGNTTILDLLTENVTIRECVRELQVDRGYESTRNLAYQDSHLSSADKIPLLQQVDHKVRKLESLLPLMINLKSVIVPCDSMTLDGLDFFIASKHSPLLRFRHHGAAAAISNPRETEDLGHERFYHGQRLRSLYQTYPEIEQLELDIGEIDKLWHPTVIPGVEVDTRIYQMLSNIAKFPRLGVLRLIPPYFTERGIRCQPLSDDLQVIKIFRNLREHGSRLHTLIISPVTTEREFLFRAQWRSNISDDIGSDPVRQTMWEVRELGTKLLLIVRQQGKNHEQRQIWSGERRLRTEIKRFHYTPIWENLCD